MKVAIVCPYDLAKPGGVQDQVIRLAEWLRGEGHDSWIVGPGADGPPGAELVGGTVTLPANRSAVPLSLDPRVIRRVRAVTERAEVIHIHEPLMPLVSLAASRIGARPSVGTFHADAPGWARTMLSASGPVTRAVTTHLDVVTAVSEVARTSIPALEPVRIIPNGIDVDAFAPAAKEPKTVLFVGRDDPRKGLSNLLDAWPEVHASHPDSVLRVVGATRAGEVDGVEFLGRIDEDRKRHLLSTSSIAVAPNTGGESFGIVVAEAMASGCAVIASALPAFVSVVGDTGELIRVDDVAEIARRLRRLLDDQARVAELGRAARERVRRFDIGSVGAQYVAAYEEAIALHR